MLLHRRTLQQFLTPERYTCPCVCNLGVCMPVCLQRQAPARIPAHIPVH